jgi:nitrite reductase/ring-hydroxylating ferredoxin subunit
MNDTARLLRALVDRVGADDRIDRVAEPLSSVAQKLTVRDDVKSFLSGTWLGHRLHPLLTDIPIGAWTSASLLDVFGGRAGRRAARRLVGVGIVASLPTAATGLSDWNDTYGETKRVGVLHAASNITALTFQIASWRARGRGHHLRGMLFSGLGGGAMVVGGYLGGHLVFAQRVGVDVDVPVADLEGWRAVCRLDDLTHDQPHGVTVDGVRLALVRRGEAVSAMAAVCSHAGGPLDEGCVRGDALQCPWHGSEFALVDGAVVRGPATSPEPVYDARVRDGMVEVRGPVPLDSDEASQRARLAYATGG